MYLRKKLSIREIAWGRYDRRLQLESESAIGYRLLHNASHGSQRLASASNMFQAKAYRPEIDGLRAIAVLSVMIYHAHFMIGDRVVFPFGFLGVDVFFVISGYLISRHILEEARQNQFSFGDFYIRRIRRILPALLVVVISTIPFSRAFLIPSEYDSYSKSIIATLYFISNILFWRQSGYFDEESSLKPLIHTWSLSVEEQFYIVFPIFLIIIFKLFKKYIPTFIVTTLLCSFFLAIWAQPELAVPSFYLLPTRVWEFFIGVMAAVYEPRWRPSNSAILKSCLSASGILMVFASVTLFDDKSLHNPGFITLLPTLGTGLFLAFGGNGDATGRILSSPLFVRIGLISYSLYLWHQPVFALARANNVDELSFWPKVALFFLSITLAIATWYFIEIPFRNATKVRIRPLLTTLAGGYLILMGFAMHGLLTNGDPGRFADIPAIAEKLNNIDRGFEVGGRNCYLNECKIGNLVEQPTVALKGDSHAGVLVKSLDEALKAKSRAAMTLANAGPPIIGDRYPAYFGGESRRSKHIAFHRSVLYDDNIRYVILSARWTHYVLGTGFDNQEGGAETLGEWQRQTSKQSAEVLTIFKAGIQDLLDHRKKIVILYPIPEVGSSVPQTIHKKLKRKDWTPLSTRFDLYKQRNELIIGMLDSFGEDKNIIRIYPDNIMCNTLIPGRCATHNDDFLFYFDSDHITKPMADILVKDIIGQMEERWGF